MLLQRCLPKTHMVHTQHVTTRFCTGTGFILATFKAHILRQPIHSLLLHSLCTHTSSKILRFYIAWIFNASVTASPPQQIVPVLTQETTKTSSISHRKTGLSHALPNLSLLN